MPAAGPVGCPPSWGWKSIRARFPSPVRQVDFAPHKPALARVGQQLARQIGCAFAGAHDLRKSICAWERSRGAPSTPGWRSRMPGAIIEIVRDAPGEQARLSNSECCWRWRSNLAVPNVANVSELRSFSFRYYVWPPVSTCTRVCSWISAAVGEARTLAARIRSSVDFSLGRSPERSVSHHFPPPVPRGGSANRASSRVCIVISPRDPIRY